MIPGRQRGSPAVSPPPERSRTPLPRVLIIALLAFVVSLLTDLRVLPADPARGQDYNDFYVAAVAQRDGLNLYDGAVLTRIEERTFGKSSFSNTVASPPAFFVAMRPLTWLAPGIGYLVWTLGSVALYLASLVGLWRAWTGARPRSPVFWALALSPPAIITVFLGQVTLIATAACIWAVAAISAGRPWRAGFLLALTLVIPHVMVVPIALICGLSWRAGGKETAIATATWAVMLSAAALPLAEPGSLGHWLRALTSYGNTFDHWQPDLSSLAGIYIPLVSRAVGHVLSILALLAGAGLAAAIIAGDQRRALAVGSGQWWRWVMLGTCAWLVVLPYEHPYDAVLLLPAFLLLIAGERPHTIPAEGAPGHGTRLEHRSAAGMTPQPLMASVGAAPAHGHATAVAPVAAMRPQSQARGPQSEARARPAMSAHTLAIQGMALAAVGAMICLPEMDLMGFRPNLTFSYTVIPELLATAALAQHLRLRAARVPSAAGVQPASPAPQSAAETVGPGRAWRRGRPARR
jgi:hypothetical protein